MSFLITGYVHPPTPSESTTTITTTTTTSTTSTPAPPTSGEYPRIEVSPSLCVRVPSEHIPAPLCNGKGPLSASLPEGK